MYPFIQVAQTKNLYKALFYTNITKTIDILNFIVYNIIVRITKQKEIQKMKKMLY